MDAEDTFGFEMEKSRDDLFDRLALVEKTIGQALEGRFKEER
jgi:hypothetical protein